MIELSLLDVQDQVGRLWELFEEAYHDDDLEDMLELRVKIGAYFIRARLAPALEEMRT